MGLHEAPVGQGLPNAAKSPDADTRKESTGVQHLRLEVACARVKITAKNNPKTGHEHGVLAGENFSKHACRQRAENASQLQHRSQPSLVASRVGNGGEVVFKSGHDKGLAEDALLVAIFEASKPVDGLD